MRVLSAGTREIPNPMRQADGPGAWAVGPADFVVRNSAVTWYKNMMANQVAFACGCVSGPRPLWRAFTDILEEVREFVEEPSREEASDVMFTLGRFIAALRGRIYCRVPGDALTVEKMVRRAQTSGCVRSLNHRPAGVCASTLS